jgi:hypothetical protein
MDESAARRPPLVPSILRFAVPLIRARRWRVLLLGAVVVGLVTPSMADADRRDDQRADLVERQRALVAELDTLHASDAELVAAIGVLDEYVALKLAEVSQAQDLYASAYVVAEQARRAEEAKREEVEVLEEQMATMAVAAYVAPPQTDSMETMLLSNEPSEAASLAVYLDVQNGRDTDIVRQLRAARAELGDHRRVAEEAELRATTARDDAVRELSDLLGARQEQSSLRELVLARTSQATYESDLVALEIDRVNRELLEETRATRAAPLESVRGIRVHRSIAPQLAALLDAAEADGIILRGGGFRTPEEQIALRRAHCGDDPYSIWEKPANECSPPTATPGTSLHELGLAVDFMHNGSTISSHASPAFKWLAANASRFGFYNLPSEPWHWSVDGS